MAVIESVPGIKVTIESNGATLPEYGDAEGSINKQDKVSSTFVECLSDSEFSISAEVNPLFNMGSEAQSLAFQYIVDGKTIGHHSVHRERLRTRWKHVCSKGIERVSPTEVMKKKLKFAVIQKVDDGDETRIRADAQKVKGVGEILVHVHRTSKSLKRRVFVPKVRLESSTKEVAEKALKGKALSHGVEFVEGRLERRPPGFKTTYPDGYSNPVGVFIFKYRSRADLQAELIIPRSPSPELDILAASNGNGGNNQERIAALKREIEQIKKEEGADEPTPRGRKRGLDEEGPASGRVYKTIRMENGAEAFDLTDD